MKLVKIQDLFCLYVLGYFIHVLFPVSMCVASWSLWVTIASWDLWWCARRRHVPVCPSRCLSVWWCWVSAPSVCRCSTACTPPFPTSHPTSSTRDRCRMVSLPVGAGLAGVTLLVDTVEPLLRPSSRWSVIGVRRGLGHGSWLGFISTGSAITS